MSAETQNTIILLAIIASIAILSLAVLPMLRRRLAGRAAAAARGRTAAEVSQDRLAAVIGAKPTLSAPVPTGPPDVLVGVPFADQEPAGGGHPDAIDAVAAAAAQAASSEADASLMNDDRPLALGFAGHAMSGDIDESATASQGFSIAPEDERASATIDALLGARRAAESPTESAPQPAPQPPTESAPQLAPQPPTESAPQPPAPQPVETGIPVMAAMAGDGIPEPTIDPETGLDTPMAWTSAVILEEARSSRYGRPVAVVIAELDGLDRLAERFGQEAADRLIPPVADAFRRNARAADRVARLSRTRFGVLLVETDEIQAINYVERVRLACDRWLEAGAITVRLSIGWASPATDGDLRSAVRIAEERMYREQHRPAPWRTVVGTPSSNET